MKQKPIFKIPRRLKRGYLALKNKILQNKNDLKRLKSFNKQLLKVKRNTNSKHTLKSNMYYYKTFKYMLNIFMNQCLVSSSISSSSSSSSNND